MQVEGDIEKKAKEVAYDFYVFTIITTFPFFEYELNIIYSMHIVPRSKTYINNVVTRPNPTLILSVVFIAQTTGAIPNSLVLSLCLLLCNHQMTLVEREIHACIIY